MAIIKMSHVARLPRHCTPGVVRYLQRLDMTIADLVAGRLDSVQLRALGGHAARTVSDFAEVEEAEIEAARIKAEGSSANV